MVDFQGPISLRSIFLVGRVSRFSTIVFIYVFSVGLGPKFSWKINMKEDCVGHKFDAVV